MKNKLVTGTLTLAAAMILMAVPTQAQAAELPASSFIEETTVEKEDGYTGLIQMENGWYYMENGEVDFGYSGLIPYGDAWWCVAGGQVCFDYTGLWSDPNVGWWYVENGAINFGYNGLVPYGDAWWCVAGGAVCFDYTGLWCDPTVGWWYVENGAINFAHTGMVPNEYGWWYVTNGALDWGFNGLGENEAGKWVYRNGCLDWGCYGVYSYNGVNYNVSGGHVDGVASDGGAGNGGNNGGTSDGGNADGSGNGAADNGGNGGSADNGTTDGGTVVETPYHANDETAFLADNGKWYWDYTKYGHGVYDHPYYGTIKKDNYTSAQLVNCDNRSALGVDWRMVVNGEIDYSFTGIADVENNGWYFENGRPDFTKNTEPGNDYYYYDRINGGLWYTIRNGRALVNHNH